jgi:hypothetical protein
MPRKVWPSYGLPGSALAARELNQFVLHIDDLIQPRAEQIT